MTENNQQPEARSGLIRVMGLWENSDRRGNKYLSGNLTQNIRVMIFRNSFKQEGGRDPDYILYISQRAGDERGPSGDVSAGSQQAAGGPAPLPEDDIPF